MADDNTPENGPEEEQEDPQEDPKPKPKPGDEQKLTKAEWQEEFNKKVLPNRLQRKEAEILKTLGLNSLDEYATIQEKANKYEAEVNKNKTEEERRAERDAERDRKLAELQQGLAERDRKLLVTDIADEFELPKKLRGFLQGSDEESLRESAQSLLDAVSEVGGPKKDTSKKSPDDSVKEKKTAYAGGGKKPDSTVDPKALAEKIRKRQGGLFPS
jgi:hypothetical protein